MKSFLSFISLGIVLLLFLFVRANNTHAQNNYLAANAEELSKNIDLFFQAGAKGFLVWQYSGNLQETYFANDNWSFFQTDTAICEVLKQKSEEYPNNFVGVNMYNVGSSEFANGGALQHMIWLKQNCGVSVIRIFAKVEKVIGVSNALSAANSAGVKLIIAIGDYSNGGGGMPSGAGKTWYESGFKGEYKTLATNLVNNFSGNPALFGFELANEPHCSGDATAIDAYKNWGVEIGNILGAATANIGYGQMASQNTTRCDSPGSGDFLKTNNIPQITMTSAHFYTDSEKQNALLALEQSKTLGKMFYIGEAPPGSSVLNESSPYNLDKYPSYNVDDDDFYLTPIAQADYPAGGNKLGAIVKELTYTGYETYCEAEDVIIEPQYDTDALIKKYIREHPNKTAHLKTTSVEEVNYSNAKYPVWRDVSGKQFLFSSLEEYAGFKDVYEKSPAKSEINSAPPNSLLSNKQACIQGWKNLDAQTNMCERLASPDNCALYPRLIPDTSFTIKTLIEKRLEFIEYISELKRQGVENINADCETLLSEQYPQWDDLTKGLINVPSNFDRDYRIGFVVAVIHTTLPKLSEVPLTIFNFLTFQTKISKPTDEVLVAAFKLPDIGTNKGDKTGEHISVSERWLDPLDLTRKVLSTASQEAKYVKDRDHMRSHIRSLSINSGEKNQDENSKIYCYEGTEWPPTKDTEATDTCKNEFPRALVNMINGAANKCDGNNEPSNIIKDIASLGDPTDSRRIFKGGSPENTSGGQVLLNLFENKKTPIANYNKWNNLGYADPRSAKNDFDSHRFDSVFEVNEKNYPAKITKNTTADFYLIYPVGFDLKEIEKTLKGAFFSSTQIESMNKRAPNNKFSMTNAIEQLHGGADSYTFEDTEATDNEECGLDLGGVPLPCHKTFSINITGGGAGMGVLGGKFGWWLRQIQESLNARASSAHQYLQSCKLTEDFLLGRCGS